MAEQQVNLTDLDPQQLQEVKKQLDQVGLGEDMSSADGKELEHLTTSYQQLKQAQSKFKSCASEVNELTPASKGGCGRLVSLGDWNVLTHRQKSACAPY